MMKIRKFEFYIFGVNTYVVWDESTSDCAIIDPGMATEADAEQLDRFISSNGLKVRHLINTHLHIDHLLGNAQVEAKYGVTTKAAPEDAFLGKMAPDQALMFHLRLSPDPVAIDVELHDGDTIDIGHGRLKVLAVPGHSPGSIALYCEEDKFVITGDALFQGSIGRTDLPGGNHAVLIDAIRRKLFTLPDDTVVYPGHGPKTTIGCEKATNPFF